MRESSESREAVVQTQNVVEEIFESSQPATSEQVAELAASVGQIFAAEGVDLGVCRRAPKFAKLQMVMTDAGLQICCTHAPPHCSSFTTVTP
jgi:hypothetical protein